MQKATCRPSRPEETGKPRNFYSWQKEDGPCIGDLDQWFEGVEGRAGGPDEQFLAGETLATQNLEDSSTPTVLGSPQRAVLKPPLAPST